jgi:coniferyl-aldehyde dehydrogenase
LTDALAAGNRVLLKMSELTPALSTLLEERVEKYFAADVVDIVNGDADTARAFSALPFDHLLFTGSTAVGHEVMRSAAANLTPVTLELGGKSPAIIGPDARFAHAVERIMLGKLLNAGQTCIAPDYVLLPRGRERDFVDIARTVVARLYPDFARNGQFAGIATERQHARLCALRDEAIAAGAVAHALADAPADARTLAPTLLTGVEERMAVMRQEIFGPLLPLQPYDTLDEAIAWVNAHPRPLALYIFDERSETVDRVLEQTCAGGVTVNDTILHISQHDLPFGGVGASGMGTYHGEDGFRTFSRRTPIFHQSRFSLVSLLNPPYGAKFRWLLRLLLGGRSGRPPFSR